MVVAPSRALFGMGVVCGLLASVICLAAGIYLIGESSNERESFFLGVGLGWYFIGKAFFVGPMLVLAAWAYRPAPPAPAGRASAAPAPGPPPGIPPPR